VTASGIFHSSVGFSPLVGEELPMTIQVGMVGTDGILIAGDTRWTASPMLVNRNWAAGRYGYNSSKIKLNHERGMAVSCAMDMGTAGHVASDIISGLREEDFEYPVGAIEEIATKVPTPIGKPRKEAHCLIALTRPVLQLFLFQFATVNEEWGPLCQPLETIGIAGDNVNAAIFWAERYYQKLPVERLVPLAAHLVVCAHKLNTGTIGGLEIVLGTASGIHRLSDESIRELETKADEWDSSIGNLFLNHRQQFTYAPNVVG